VHAHTAEIVPEARLEKRAGSRIERLPGGTKYVVDDGRHFPHWFTIHRRTLEHPFGFFAALLALTASNGVLAAGALPLQYPAWHG
jgi:hypothetical protein